LETEAFKAVVIFNIFTATVIDGIHELTSPQVGASVSCPVTNIRHKIV